MKIVDAAFAVHPGLWRLGWSTVDNWPGYRWLHLGPIALLFWEGLR